MNTSQNHWESMNDVTFDLAVRWKDSAGGFAGSLFFRAYSKTGLSHWSTFFSVNFELWGWLIYLRVKVSLGSGFVGWIYVREKNFYRIIPRYLSCLRGRNYTLVVLRYEYRYTNYMISFFFLRLVCSYFMFISAHNCKLLQHSISLI